MLGREVLLPASLIAAPPDDTIVTNNFVATFQDALQQAHQQVRTAMGAAAQTEKRYFDRRVKYHPFHVGQKVWLFWPKPLIRQQKCKLTQLWTGPWTIIQILSPLVAQVSHTRTNKKQTVHADHLSPCLAENTDMPQSNNFTSYEDHHPKMLRYRQWSISLLRPFLP